MAREPNHSSRNRPARRSRDHRADNPRWRIRRGRGRSVRSWLTRLVAFEPEIRFGSKLVPSQRPRLADSPSHKPASAQPVKTRAATIAFYQ
jgi:hypothetical protein